MKYIAGTFSFVLTRKGGTTIILDFVFNEYPFSDGNAFETLEKFLGAINYELGKYYSGVDIASWQTKIMYLLTTSLILLEPVSINIMDTLDLRASLKEYHYAEENK